MLKVIFNYKGSNIEIYCNEEEKMRNIINILSNKIEYNINNIYFTYNGNKINEELKIKEIINEEDKKRNIINILINENDKSQIIENKNEIKEIICPECKENILIKIEDYKINLYNCKNGHKYNNILIKELEEYEKIDISKIICNICKINNKGNIYNNEIYRCITCNNNICPLCKIKHDKNHKIINYDNKNYICNRHNEIYIKYCEKCKINICMKCEKEHKEHNNNIYLGDLLINDNYNIDEFKEYINILNNNIREIIDKLNNIINNVKIYYNISNNIIKNENRNYEILKNKNEFINYNNKIINDIKNISNDYNIINKFKNIIKIYNNINNINYIISEVDIKEEDINKDIKIISSYEQSKKENEDIEDNK